MKKPQWIVIFVAIFLIAVLYFSRTVPRKTNLSESTAEQSVDSGEDHNVLKNILPTDSILALAKIKLTPAQLARLKVLEDSVNKSEKNQRLHLYHQLARFWSDSAGIFEPYAWFEAEAARLENSEKSLNFAARLFLDNLQNDGVLERRQWKALQAKDLFERSLKINPENDSAKVGFGAVYLFGNISTTPMEGIAKIRSVAEKDSTNLYAQIMLAKGSILSGQYDKAISRLLTINRLQTGDLETILMLADTYERTGDKTNAILWYRKSLPLIKQPEMRKAVENRVDELGK